jgi:hypothetical protein
MYYIQAVQKSDIAHHSELRQKGCLTVTQRLDSFRQLNSMKPARE